MHAAGFRSPIARPEGSAWMPLSCGDRAARICMLCLAVQQMRITSEWIVQGRGQHIDEFECRGGTGCGELQVNYGDQFSPHQTGATVRNFLFVMTL